MLNGFVSNTFCWYIFHLCDGNKELECSCVNLKEKRLLNWLVIKTKVNMSVEYIISEENIWRLSSNKIIKIVEGLVWWKTNKCEIGEGEPPLEEAWTGRSLGSGISGEQPLKIGLYRLCITEQRASPKGL